MRSPYRKRLLSGAAYAVIVGLAIANNGCFYIAAGATGCGAVAYAYCAGKMCDTFNASPDDTWAAVRTAVTELGMPIVKEERTGANGFIESHTADGERVRIYLEADTSKIPVDGQISHVCVRVATFGDRPVSYRIMDQVALHLAPAPPSTPPPSAANSGLIQPTVPVAAPPVPLQDTPPPPLSHSELI